jgi:hypothetical protein
MLKVNWSQLSVLVTGGTGSFGKKFIDIMLGEYHPRRLRGLLSINAPGAGNDPNYLTRIRGA